MMVPDEMVWYEKSLMKSGGIRLCRLLVLLVRSSVKSTALILWKPTEPKEQRLLLAIKNRIQAAAINSKQLAAKSHTTPSGKIEYYWSTLAGTENHYTRLATVAHEVKRVIHSSIDWWFDSVCMWHQCISAAEVAQELKRRHKCVHDIAKEYCLEQMVVCGNPSRPTISLYFMHSLRSAVSQWPAEYCRRTCLGCMLI